MSEKIWIINHYATNQFFDGGGRHQWFAKYLKRAGYGVRIFCANTIHGEKSIVNLYGNSYLDDIGKDNVPYTFIKAPAYQSNGIDRIKNMIVFYKNIMFELKRRCKEERPPDVIIASSVHPLALVAGMRFAKKNNLPCICEIRDLWPESIVSYGLASRNNIIINCLYKLEKRIYEKADSIIFTMEGGKDYIVEKGWDIANGGKVDLEKVYYINNGVDLEAYDWNKKTRIVEDSELDSVDYKKVIYTGSMGLINNVDQIVEAARLLQDENILFLLYGDGNMRNELEKKTEKLEKVHLKGKIKKEYVPYVLSKADICITDVYSDPLFRFGISPNKLFEYIASGKPIVSCLPCKYDIVQKFNIGITVEDKPIEIANAIRTLLHSDNSLEEKLQIARESFDFKNLTDELLRIINQTKNTH